MRRILVVDDREEVRDLLEATLRRGNYQIITAGNGQEAVEVAGNRRPHVIIMDVLMPGSVDGIEATRILKADARTRDSKILILTGKEAGQMAEEATTAGADAYLAKPFSPLLLLRTVDALVAQYPSGDQM
jgi:CheY-like chemotaxis protein